MSICRNPNCAKENPDDLTFCKYCGRRLKQPRNNSKKPLIMIGIAAGLILLLIFTKSMFGSNKQQASNGDSQPNTSKFFGQNKNTPKVEGVSGYNIVFTRGEGPVREIYINKEDGTIGKVTNSNTINQFPSFSPDRKRIAFERKENKTTNVYVINLDGTGEKKIAEGHEPTWSADGSKVIFYNKNPKSISNIVYSITPDGSEQKELTTTEDSYYMARYSPDGTKIALSKYSVEGWGIYTVGPDLSGRKTISISPKPEGNPAWSSDGSKIVFNSERDGNLEIYAADLNRNVIRVTNNKVPDFNPSFTQDGKIIFTREETGSTNIYIVDADGSNERLLIKNAAYASSNAK